MSIDPSETKFVFNYELVVQEGQLKVKETPKFENDRQRLLRRLWIRIWGN